jgi:hypothetical protein
VLEASPRALRVVAEIVKIAFGNDAERSDGRQRATLGAVDLVDAITVAHLLSVRCARKVKNPPEHVTRLFVTVSLACTTTAPDAAVPSVNRSRVVPFPHDRPLT